VLDHSAYLIVSGVHREETAVIARTPKRFENRYINQKGFLVQTNSDMDTPCPRRLSCEASLKLLIEQGEQLYFRQGRSGVSDEPSAAAVAGAEPCHDIEHSDECAKRPVPAEKLL
jgi:hypothetical protein